MWIGFVLTTNGNETSNILNHIDNNNRYCIHSNYFNKKLRHEDIINSTNTNEIMLKCRSIKNKENLDELENIDDNLIIIKHLFNNIYITFNKTPVKTIYNIAPITFFKITHF